jgi:hypothetical protein
VTFGDISSFGLGGISTCPTQRSILAIRFPKWRATVDEEGLYCFAAL